MHAILTADLAGVPLRRLRGGVSGNAGVAAFAAAVVGLPRFRPSCAPFSFCVACRFAEFCIRDEGSVCWSLDRAHA